MIGSPGIAADVALWGFWILLGIGIMRGELGVKGIAIFVMLWLAGFVGVRWGLNGLLFAPYVAVLDVALVLAIFKGDVRLT